MKIYGFSTQNNGCGKYRIWEPLEAIRRHGFADVSREPDEPQSISIERADQIFRDNDIIFCQPFSEMWAACIFMGARDEHKKKIVVDLDDNVWAVHPMNIGPVNGQLTYLKSHFEGNFDDFWKLEPLDGKNLREYQKRIDGTVVKRDDGKQFFLKNTRPDVKLAVEFMLREADAVTTTNEVLAKVIEKYTDKPVFVLKNCLNLKNWKKARPHPKSKWIGWSGSVSHYPDLKGLMPAFDNLMKEHADLNVQIMGSSFDYLFPIKEGSNTSPVKGYGPSESMFYADLSASGERWPGRMSFHKPVPVQEYDSWMSDNFKSIIGIAPIEENDFNDSKSELKWLEYAALGVPCIASNFGPYKRTIKNGIDGLLLKGSQWWEIGMDQLLKNQQLRYQMAENARKRLESEYEINSQCHRWMEVFNAVCSSELVSV